MILLTQEIKRQLLENAVKQTTEGSIDYKPVVKFFTPDGNATWLITEMDEAGRMFGLCDLGLGFPGLGYVYYEQLANLRGNLGLPVERDLHFIADKTLSVYADSARELRRVVA